MTARGVPTTHRTATTRTATTRTATTRTATTRGVPMSHSAHPEPAPHAGQHSHAGQHPAPHDDQHGHEASPRKSGEEPLAVLAVQALDKTQLPYTLVSDETGERATSGIERAAVDG